MEHERNESLTRREVLLLEDYKIAAELYARDADRYWVRYDVFLGLNSAMLAAFALLADRLVQFRLIGVAFGILGVASCLVWLFIAMAGTANFVYWPKRAADIIKELPELQTLSEVYIDKYFANRRFFSRASVTRVSYPIPVLFTGIWLVLGIWISLGGVHLW